MHLPIIERERYQMRPWCPEDASSLVQHANNPKVAQNLRDGFPYPYTMDDAQRWLDMVGENRTDLILAIEIDGKAALQTRWLRIFATIFQHNKSSMRVLEKCGFTLEAIHKHTVMKEGELLDEHLFALLKEQWKVNKSRT